MKRKKGLIVVFFMMIFLVASCTSLNKIQIKDAWARPGLQNSNSAVYFTILNQSSDTDSLIKASSDIAEHVEIHMSMMDQSGTMVMKPQESVSIPENSSVEFKPGGLHIMLINLPQELKPNDQFKMILEFEKIGNITIDVIVKQP